jgi:hypothetical protein
MTGTLDLLDHEPPPRRAIERELHIIDTVQLRKPGAQRPTSRRLIRPRETSPLPTSTVR